MALLGDELAHLGENGVGELGACRYTGVDRFLEESELLGHGGVDYYHG